MYSCHHVSQLAAAGICSWALIGGMHAAAVRAEEPTINPATSVAFAAPPSWSVIPGGIADNGGNTAYVAGASDSVEALDMQNGHVLWECKEAIRPLAIDGNRVITQGPRVQQQPNTMTVIILDSTTGNVQLQSQPIVFPDWIAVDGGIGLQFASVATVENGELLIRWQAYRQSVQPGPKVTAEVIAAARKSTNGVARVDLDSGRATVEEDDVPKQLKQPRLGRFTDVGEKRLTMTERPQNVPGGIQLVHRTLEAADKRSGRPLWRHEIAGEVILPDVPPTAERAPNNVQQPQQRR